MSQNSLFTPRWVFYLGAPQMLFLPLLLLLSAVLADTLDVRWQDDIGIAGNLCSTLTGTCQSFAHVVFSATPLDATHILTGYAKFSLDDGDMLDSHNITFESHLVTGTCTSNGTCTDFEGVSQMFNWGFEREYLLADEVELLPSNICIQPYVWDTATNESGTLSRKCLNFSETVMLKESQSNSVSSVVNNFSSAVTTYCSPTEPAQCRNNIHIVFSASNPDPTIIMLSGGAYSYDNGDSWSSMHAVSFFEQHIDSSSVEEPVYSQAFQFDYDSIDNTGLASLRTMESCVRIRIWILDPKTQQNHTVVDNNCYQICNELTYFHNLDGYCAEM